MSPLNAMIQARAVEQQKDDLRLQRHLTALASWSTTSQIKAQDMVDKWRANHLCSEVYIDAWEQLLQLNSEQIKHRITASDDFAVVLRRNSPVLMTMER